MATLDPNRTPVAGAPTALTHELGATAKTAPTETLRIDVPVARLTSTATSPEAPVLHWNSSQNRGFGLAVAVGFEPTVGALRA